MKDRYFLFKTDLSCSRLGTNKNDVKASENAMRFLFRSDKSLRTFTEKTVRKAVKPAR
jgi:hypothetical protein